MAGTFAHGTKLMIDEEQLTNLTDISGPGIDIEDLDVTDHNSADAWMEFVKGLKDAGEVSIDGNFNITNAQKMMELINASGNNDISIIFPTSPETALNLNGFVNNYEPSAPHDDKIEFSGSLKISGKPELSHDVSGGLTALEGIEETMEEALDFVPSFENDVYEYTTTVEADSTWIKLTPTAADHEITVNGQTVSSGNQSGEIALGDQGSLTNVKVKAKEEGKIAKIYEIIVTRPTA